MTFHKKYMTNIKTNPLIVKGAQIQRYFVTDTPSQGLVEYVNSKEYLKDFSKSKKSLHHQNKRICLQGISGANDKTRIISTIINENVFCANSCNYIISKVTNKSVSIFTLLGLFNSKLTNWIFRKTSTNSNVNCYEVNNLKIPKNLSLHNLSIESIVSNILDSKKKNLNTIEQESLLDLIVYKIYGINFNDVKIIDPEFSKNETDYNNFLPPIN